MKKLLIKSLLIITIALVSVIIKILISNFSDLRQLSYKVIPFNNVSNSICFKAKLDQMPISHNFKSCTFLIAGSSMSLNDISGKIIANRTNECVYNISSWGFKPVQTIEFLNLIKNNKLKYIFIAFNNIDFGKADVNIDFKATDAYLNGNKLIKYWGVINKFNFNTFSKDLHYRYRFSSITNSYESIAFDEFGSAQLDHEGFEISKKRWDTYQDTTGFGYFYNSVNTLGIVCKQRKINLILVYLPCRPNLQSAQNIIQNQAVSKVLKKRFGNAFIDIQNIHIPISQYCDATHLFREGAENITNLIIDSLNKSVFR
ncbi:hypothetical protein [Parasediminibacterium sp. JCM 36343]|uniref:hypothetical protein n=1 Tax=Parasediminibacterium sp. JCM 36343 TaxID=3374279 RepID=UPI003978BD1E